MQEVVILEHFISLGSMSNFSAEVALVIGACITAYEINERCLCIIPDNGSST